MAQWINLNQNNSFINQMRFPLFCEFFLSHAPSTTVLVGLTAGRQAEWQTKY